MGSFCQSKPATQTKTESYTADPRVATAGEQTLNMAESAAAQPFQTPARPVAGFNPFQTQAFGQYQGMQGGTDPYFASAGADMTRGEAPITQADTDQYMNPFADQALANMKKYVFDPQRTQNMGTATQTAGGVGADRLALTSQNIDKTQADAIGGASAGFYGQALSAAQEAKARALNSAQGWASLGMNKQGAGLQATGALLGAGNQQQGQTQAELMSPYEQRLAEIAYPMQQASFLSGITGNMSNVFKGTSNSNTTSQAAQPSMFNQIAGLGMAGAGLMMGNPMMAMGGLGGAMGGGGGSAGFQAGSNSPSYPNPYGGSWYGNRGGAVGYASGGDVEEYSEDQFNPLDAMAPDYSRPIERPAPNLGMWPFNRGQADYKGDVTMFPERQASGSAVAADLPGQAPPQENPLPASPPMAPEAPQSSLSESMTPDNVEGATPAINAYRQMPTPMGGSPMQPPPQRRVAQPPERSGGYGPRPSGGINSDMKMGDFEMSREKQPYPDALERDWGQKMARSPWMSLVQAGAKMAQSTKSGAAGLAEGVEAGAEHLDKQRKELRSEQQINQKAEELYRHAKSELNKYTRKTPHELATEDIANRRLEAEKYQWQSGMGPGPNGEQVQGAWRMPTRSGEQPEFMPGITMTGKTGAGSANERIAARLMEEGRANGKPLTFQEALAVIKRPGTHDPDILAKERIAVEGAKAEIGYLRNPEATIEKHRQRLGLPPSAANWDASSPSESAPPVDRLNQDGTPTTFKNGQVWKLDLATGKPVLVKK